MQRGDGAICRRLFRKCVRNPGRVLRGGCIERGNLMAWAPSSPLTSAAAALGADEWGLTMEELDSIERKAAQDLAAKRLGSPLKTRPGLLARTVEGRASPQKLGVSPIAKRPLRLKVSKEGEGKVAVEAPFNTHLLAALKSVAGHEWDPGRRLWIFPEQHLQELIGAITAVPQLEIDMQPVPPLVLPSVVSHLSRNSNSGYGVSPQSSPAKSQDSLRTMNSPSGSSPLKPLVVQIFLIDSSRIAARSPYNEKVKQAYQSIAGKMWNSEERVWMFPKANLLDLVHALQNILVPQIKIEAVPPLVLPATQVPAEGFADPSLMSSVWERGSSDTCSELPYEPSLMNNSCSKLVVKLFLHNSGLIAVKCPPSSKLIMCLRSIPKSVWNHREKLWMFPPRFLAEADKALATVDDVQCVVESLEPLVRRALEFMQTVPDLTEKYQKIPDHLESNLLPFQRDGVGFALQHGGRVLIADEMGLGKTVQAIAIASCLEEDWPVLVIVPSSLRILWATMLKTWLKLCPRDITVVLSQGSGSNREGFSVVYSAGKSRKLPLKLNGLFNIVSYDLVAKMEIEGNFKVVIADESHYIKNAQAKRTNACVPLIQKSRYAILLTGTPALSRPIELFKQLEALQGKVYFDVHEYGKRYCSGSMFGQYQGASNHEELHALMKTTVMIRRLKNEVLSELPEKRRQQVFLSLDDKGTKQIRALFNELKQIRGNVQCSLDDGIEKWKMEEKILINRIYSESAVVKLPAVQDYLSTMLEADCKFLVFAHHHSMMDGIEAHLKSKMQKKRVQYIRIDGSTPAMDRQNMVTRFQQDENVKAAVLSIRAAGIGLTLTAATTVIFAEMSWTPGDLVQAEDRAYRIGQKSSVNIYYLHAQETIDDLIWESIQHKLENLGQVLDGREEKMCVDSPSSLRQSTLKSFLRPCARSLTAQYETEKLASTQDAQSSGNVSLSQGAPTYESEAGASGHPKRFKVSSE